MLREPQLGDAIDLFEATQHPAFNEHLMWHAPPNLAAVSQRVQRVIDRAAAGACAAFSAIDRVTGRWAALFRFEPREQLVCTRRPRVGIAGQRPERHREGFT